MVEGRIVMPDPSSARLVRRRVLPPGPAAARDRGASQRAAKKAAQQSAAEARQGGSVGPGSRARRGKIVDYSERRLAVAKAIGSDEEGSEPGSGGEEEEEEEGSDAQQEDAFHASDEDMAEEEEEEAAGCCVRCGATESSEWHADPETGGWVGQLEVEPGWAPGWGWCRQPCHHHCRLPASK